MKIIDAKTDSDILKCWEVIHELRPHQVKWNFLSLIKEMMKEGYRLSFIEQEGKAIAAIGFRYLQFLYADKHFYIDDLATLTAYRKKGFGALLLDYVFAIAKQNGFKKVTLDSGHHRFDAHRLYLNKGFKISSHHFEKEI